MSNSNGLYAETPAPGEVVAMYFQALKSGDTETVKNLISGKLYEKRINLLENNQGYPAFLKRLYQGLNFQIVNTYQEADEAYVDVVVLRQNGDHSPLTLKLTKDGGESWNISDEIERP
jgi:hypothetical protein